jgi:hypothetical protein
MTTGYDAQRQLQYDRIVVGQWYKLLRYLCHTVNTAVT